MVATLAATTDSRKVEHWAVKMAVMTAGTSALPSVG